MLLVGMQVGEERDRVKESGNIQSEEIKRRWEYSKRGEKKKLGIFKERRV